jgi:hypothetical protein
LRGSRDCSIQDIDFFSRFFRFRARCFISCFTNASFDALNSVRTAASMRSASVLPGTFGAGSGNNADEQRSEGQQRVKRQGCTEARRVVVNPRVDCLVEQCTDFDAPNTQEPPKMLSTLLNGRRLTS